MFSFIEVNLVKNEFGPTVNGIGTMMALGDATQPPMKELAIPWRPLQANSSLFAFLDWQTRLSGFTGRESEMTNLLEWAESSVPISVKFISGDGGVGKSRFAAEFAEELRRRTWSTGFVNLRTSLSFPMRKPGTLLVIDYPEEQTESLKKFFDDLVHLEKQPRLRILLLSRRSPQEWTSFLDEQRARSLVDQQAIYLGNLDNCAAYKLYCSLLESAAEKMNTTPPPLSVEALNDWLAQAPYNARALFLCALALYSALHPDDNAVTFTGRDVIDALVAREYARQRKLAEKKFGTQHMEFLARLSAFTAVADKMHITEIVELVKSEKHGLTLPAGMDIEKELEEVGMLKKRFVVPLKPDILAAAHCITVLGKRPESAPGFLWDALAVNIPVGILRLSRIVYDAEIVLGMLDHRAGMWLATALEDDGDRCALLKDELLFAKPNLGLGIAAVMIGFTLYKTAHKAVEEAHLLTSLSAHMSFLGDKKGAFEILSNAVTIYRALAQIQPDDFNPALALGLNNLSGCLYSLGDGIKALETVEEAVAIRRTLAEKDPSAFEPELASSLVNLSVMRDNLEHKAEAMKAILEAVALYSRLAQQNATAYEPEFASSLNNLCAYRLEFGDVAGALDAIEQAVAIRRKLTEQNPLVFEPELALSLSNHAIVMSNLGDKEGANKSIDEALILYNKLMQQNPWAIRPELARCYCVLSTVRQKLGDSTGALDAIEKSIAIYELLEQQNPSMYTPLLAKNQHLLSSCRYDLGDKKGALDAISEALKIYRVLAKQSPEVFEPKLAECLELSSVFLSELHDPSGAAAALQEALIIYRKLEKGQPAAYAPMIAANLNSLGLRKNELADNQKAIQAMQEAETIYRTLARQFPEVYYPLLSKVLNNLSNVSKALGDNNGALAAIQEASAIRRRLYERQSVNYDVVFIQSMLNYESLLADNATRIKERMLSECESILEQSLKRETTGVKLEFMKEIQQRLEKLRA